jgi:CHAT domain-containing protein/tetratricopeptide (TPR) repeat protein
LDHEPIAATALHQKATIEYLRDQLDAARADWQAALDIQQAAGQTAQSARTLNYLAKIDTLRGRPTEAEPLYRRALQLQGTAHAYPAVYYLTSCNLAEILHDEGKTDEAIGLVEEAVKFIETPRAGTIGGESQRADYFAQFANAFDLLVSWNLEAARVADAFAFAERGRNRTFLDELSLAGVDLRDTLSGPDADKLRSRERQLRAKLGTLEAQAQAAVESSAAKGSPKPLVADLSRQLDVAQNDYAQVWSEIRSASPYYRQQLSAESGKLGSLDAVRQELSKLHSIMLFYYVGAKKSFLLVIDPDEKDVSIIPLEVPTTLADSMSVKPGPVTRTALVQLVSQYLADVRDRAGGRGLAGVVHSEKGIAAADQGTTLAEVLVPRSVRNLVERRAPQSVIIVPDGALHELPFEALLLESQPSPKYLLDVFPPIAYAPSANILMNLAERPAPDLAAPAVLTVGNPKYPQSAGGNERKTTPAKESLTAVSRAAYLGLGGQLPPLPATAKECQRVAKAFASAKVIDLEADQATEQNVRQALPGCRFIHLAAHGLVDQQHDNLFGAIALTPPAQAIDSSDNDGFLSLHEIHSLPLSACQLAVLSACQTNVGPDRPLEAGSTLAQAFLAAGARRAVCSHWNVDDASTAELIGGFFERVAASSTLSSGRGAGGEGAALDFAKALHDARVAVRSQSQWTSPYYWAPFVLIGPPQ